MPEITIEKALAKWKDKHGVDTRGSYGNTFKKLPISKQRHLIIIFLRWMRMVGYEETHFTSTTFANNLAETWTGSAPWASKERKKNAEEAVKSELKNVLLVEEIFSGKRRRKNRAQAQANASAAKKADDDARAAREARAAEKAAKEAEARAARAAPRQEPKEQPVRPDATDTPYDAQEDTVPDEEFLNELKEALNERS